MAALYRELDRRTLNCRFGKTSFMIRDYRGASQALIS